MQTLQCNLECFKCLFIRERKTWSEQWKRQRVLISALINDLFIKILQWSSLIMSRGFSTIPIMFTSLWSWREYMWVYVYTHTYTNTHTHTLFFLILPADPLRSSNSLPTSGLREALTEPEHTHTHTHTHTVNMAMERGLVRTWSQCH